MSREQAEDYEDKKRAIMDAAAALFARVGYPSAQLKEVAKVCGASKSMLYHYFPAKDDLLFAILTEHLQSTITTLEDVDDAGPAEKRLRAMITLYIQKSTQTRTRHTVAMNDVKYLSAAPLKRVVELERRLLKLFEAAVHALDPKLDSKLVGPNAMLLMGMMNWTDFWYRKSGSLTPDELCELISTLFLRGFYKAN